jgi:hypothetical protein
MPIGKALVRRLKTTYHFTHMCHGCNKQWQFLKLCTLDFQSLVPYDGKWVFKKKNLAEKKMYLCLCFGDRTMSGSYSFFSFFFPSIFFKSSLMEYFTFKVENNYGPSNQKNPSRVFSLTSKWKVLYRSHFSRILSLLLLKSCHSKHVNTPLLPQNSHVPLAVISKQGGYPVGQKQLWYTRLNTDGCLCRKTQRKLG